MPLYENRGSTKRWMITGPDTRVHQISTLLKTRIKTRYDKNKAMKKSSLPMLRVITALFLLRKAYAVQFRAS
jgi:hypothetical protein